MADNYNEKLEKLYTPKHMKKAKPEQSGDEGIISQARERARSASDYWADNWKAAEDDVKFLLGEQWPEQVRTERELEQRPCLVNNVLPTFVDQVLGDQRQNRPAIKVSATDVVRVPTQGNPEGESLKIKSQTGKTEYELGEVMTGIIKNIEYNCDAETAYDMAFQSAVESGMGFLRVRSDYLSDKSFEQELIIEHIENQFGVRLDPEAKKQDYSDGNWCFIDDVMLKEDFKARYPDKTAEPISNEEGDLYDGWFSDNTVSISEYYTREPCVKEVALLSDGRSVYKDEIEPIIDELLEKNITIVRERKVNTHKTFWRLISGAETLEGPIEIPSSTIPLRPVWGKCTVLKRKRLYRSIIRHSKDAQRMKNYWDSAATESVALAPKAPFIGTEEQIEGYEDIWETANTKNHAILTYNQTSPGDLGPRREQPAATPAAEITMSMESTANIKSTLGMYDASLGAQGSETSGKAIIARQRQGDRGSYAFIDNLSKAIKGIGRVLVEMIPVTMDTEQVVRLKFEDESEDFIKLNEKVFDDESKEWVTINDLNVSKYDVVVTTGPAYATQRQEAADSMIQFAQAVPQAAGIIADLVALNMDWPGADTISERLKKIVPPEVLTQDEREQLEKDMPPAPTEPNPEQMVQMKELEARAAEAEAKAVTAQTEIAKAQADVEQEKQKTIQAQLKTEEAQASLAQIDAQVAGGNIQAELIREIVAEALAELQIQQA